MRRTVGRVPGLQRAGVGVNGTLDRAADRVWCPRCLRKWRRAEVDPCPWPATATLTDAHRKTAHVCASHAAHPSANKMERRADDSGALQTFTCGRCKRVVRAFAGGVVAAFDLHARECAAPRCPDISRAHRARTPIRSRPVAATCAPIHSTRAARASSRRTAKPAAGSMTSRATAPIASTRGRSSSPCQKDRLRQARAPRRGE